jgi:hypothetical protein
MMAVKALTIFQPFAAMIATGAKFVENRSWETRYRGPLAIHAGKGTQYLTAAELREVPHGGFVAKRNHKRGHSTFPNKYNVPFCDFR